MNEGIKLSIRRLVKKRAVNRCEYCQAREDCSPDPFSVEHIVPRSKGGESSLQNLCLSCQGCNNHKYTRISHTDDTTGQEVELYNPRQHRWADHFIWDSNPTKILARTPSGRATLSLLRLNRPGLIGLREALIAIAKHPP